MKRKRKDKMKIEFFQNLFATTLVLFVIVKMYSVSFELKEIFFVILIYYFLLSMLLIFGGLLIYELVRNFKNKKRK